MNAHNKPYESDLTDIFQDNSLKKQKMHNPVRSRQRRSNYGGR